MSDIGIITAVIDGKRWTLRLSRHPSITAQLDGAGGAMASLQRFIDARWLHSDVQRVIALAMPNFDYQPLDRALARYGSARFAVLAARLLEQHLYGIEENFHFEEDPPKPAPAQEAAGG